jgi:hypothetical protein
VTAHKSFTLCRRMKEKIMKQESFRGSCVVVHKCLPLIFALLMTPVLVVYAAAQEKQEFTTPEKRAECSNYSVRRIEFINNVSIMDRYLRRPITLSEGKRLSEKDIQSTIKKLNGLKRIEKMTREDIKIGYGVYDPGTPAWHCFADVLIHVKERKRYSR